MINYVRQCQTIMLKNLGTDGPTHFGFSSSTIFSSSSSFPSIKENGMSIQCGYAKPLFSVTVI